MSKEAETNEITFPACANVKSRRSPKHKCTNPATHGAFCGRHYKHPVPWKPFNKPITRSITMSRDRIGKWYRFWLPFRKLHRHGIGYWDRSILTNDTDFFSTDAVSDISGMYFFSYRDTDGHCYGFDIRSIYTIIYKAANAGEAPLNPYNRSVISEPVQSKIKALAAWLQKMGFSVEWAPLMPPTPEQQWRMKVVDLFTKIDELNYYSSPDWFINLNRTEQRKFYSEIHSIWTHRAGLTGIEKSNIVPNYYQTLFRHPPWALGDQPLESLQKINMGVIRLFITSAKDRNDRILGAMYVVSALTLVSEQAKSAYPWLYESVFDENTPYVPAPRNLGNYFGAGFWTNIMNLSNHMPVLQLPVQAHPQISTISQHLTDSKDDESDSDSS